MPNPTLRRELVELQAALSRSDSLLASARGHASMPVIPNAPHIGLPMITEALAAQQEALAKMYRVLEKITE